MRYTNPRLLYFTLIQCCLLIISGADGTQQSIVAIRISRPDVRSSLSSLAVDQIIVTVTMSREYPQVPPAVSVSGDQLHRRIAAQLSAALTEEAKRLTGQPMILDKCYNTLFLTAMYCLWSWPLWCQFSRFIRVLIGFMAFLLPIQQCQCTEGNRIILHNRTSSVFISLLAYIHYC